MEERLLSKRSVVICMAALLSFAVGTGLATAQPSGGTTLLFETEIVELNLSGPPVPLPLASDPANDLDGSDGGPPSVDGYGFVNSAVTITLSSQRSVDPGPPSQGEAFAFGPTAPQTTDPDLLDGHD